MENKSLYSRHSSTSSLMNPSKYPNNNSYKENNPTNFSTNVFKSHDLGEDKYEPVFEDKIPETSNSFFLKVFF